MDFTLTIYTTLIETLQNQGFLFQAFADFIGNPEKRVIVLRHDVDRLPANSLIFARIQAKKGIKGTYYFPSVPQSLDEKVIKKIYELGHEVGYHYEDVSLIAERQKGAERKEFARWANLARSQTAGVAGSEITEKEVCIKKYEEEEYERYLASLAIVSFKENLARLRELVPVKTICMHGNPMSRWDSRLLWKYYDYRDFGIIGEPYFDVDFDEVLYLTDTGRCWDGDSFNIRDKSINRKERKVNAKTEQPAPSTQHPAPFPYFHSTLDIIKAAEGGSLPDKIMMTFHPQRWTDKPGPWVKELVWQNTKNVIKYFVLKIRQ